MSATDEAFAQGDRSVVIGRNGISSIIVTGDHNTVTIVYQDGEKRTVLFLAPPRPPYALVGRDELLRDLKRRLIAGGSLAFSALSGLPGVGKTALAVELANDREVLGHFRDGVLWARLGRQADVLALLGSWGAVLGIPASVMAEATNAEARADAIHAAIGTRRMLLVADDAWQVEMALAFRLGGPNCAHLVTTRLPEVAVHFAGEGATLVHELSGPDGLSLLRQLAPEVVEAETKEARELVRAVGGLPLALILMGNYLRVQSYSARPGRVRDALAQLKKPEERLRLDQPQAPLERHPSIPAETPLSLLTSIGISYEALANEARRALRSLSVFPPKPNSFSEAAAVAVADADTKVLNELLDRGLLESSGPARYTLHQTIVDYARAKLNGSAAYERMARFFVDYVEAHRKDYVALDPETDNVLAALHYAFEEEMPATLVRGANAVYPFLDARGLYATATIHLTRASDAAESAGDPMGLVTTLLSLGQVRRNTGEYGRSEQHLREGLALAEEIRDRNSIVDILQNLGRVAASRGEYTVAQKHYKEGLALARDMGDQHRTSALLQYLGTAALNEADLEQAEEFYQEGLTLADEVGDRDKMSTALQGLGAVADSRGYYERAEELYGKALILSREIGHRERTSVLLSNLGGLASVRGHHVRAQSLLREGLELARKAGHLENVSLLLSNLGETVATAGDDARAEEFYREGLALARKIGHPKRITVLLMNMGALLGTRGDYKQAEEHLAEALSLAREIGQDWFISAILNQWGELQLTQEKPGLASTAFTEALEIGREVGSQEFVATALFGLARVAGIGGDTLEAYHRGQESLAIFEGLGHHSATEVAEWLSKLGTVDRSQ